jgi:sulfonate transport system substrate-binding protein
LAEGKADLFLWEKFMTRPLVVTGEFRQVGEVTPPWNSFVLVMRQDVIDKNPELVERFKAAIGNAGRGFKSIIDAPEQIVSRYHISLDDAREWFRQVKYYDGNTDFFAAIDRTAALLHRFNITKRVPASDELLFRTNGDLK